MARTILLSMAILLMAPVVAQAQDRQNVVFQITYNQTVVGQSVFVLGDLAELGANDIRKAVKLEPTQWPLWKATISLPVNSMYTFRYYRRDDSPGRLSDTTNQLAISSPVTASTATVATGTKAIVYHSGFNPPILYWRTPTTPPSANAFTRIEMGRIGPGRGAGESRWIAPGIGTGKKPIEFYITSPDGLGRDPAGSATYLTSLDGVFLQDGNIYSYVPAPTVSPWRADYAQNSPPTIFSTNLNETRAYRVVLPRGYTEHAARRYPVIYFHDGQNMFQFVSGTFGTWNAHTTAAALTQQGQMREAIMVGADNGPNRISDYAAPDSGGWGNKYAAFLINELKPRIDQQYRTMPDRDSTTTAGSSMGAQISMYLGWDYTSAFSRIGAFSGAWNVYNSGFYNRVMADTVKRNIRVYLDSGDAGTANDNYWLTFNLRDDLFSQAGEGTYALEGDLKHAIGLGQQHNEAAWSARLPDALRFLVPATEDQGSLLPFATGAAFDLNSDGAATIDDLYAAFDQPRDVNLDGVANAEDAGAVEWYLRRAEAAGMVAGRR